MATLESLLAGSAVRMAARIRAGQVCPVELAEAALAKVAARGDPALFISVTADRAMAEARAAKARALAGRPASALDGVPIVWKDNIDIAGTVTTAASDLRRTLPPATADQVAAARAVAGGMVTIGKVNMSEFAYSGLGLNPHFGTPRNPHGTVHRSPGGSSSGSGVAVAAGIVPCAVGTDTGGSVRIPAAFNGVVGYKTSEGLIETSGIVPLSYTLDTVGVLARSVEDCRSLSGLLRGVDLSMTPVEPGALGVMVPEESVLEGLEPAVAASFEASLARLARAGVRVRRGRVPALAAAAATMRAHGTLTAAEAYRAMQAIMEGPEVARVDPRVVVRVMLGKAMSALDVVTILQSRKAQAALLAEALAGDLLVMPTTAMVAPEVSPLEADPDLFMKTNLAALRNTVLGNVLNLCGLAIPNGADAAGMPTSFALYAPGGQDARLLAAGMALEAAIRGD